MLKFLTEKKLLTINLTITVIMTVVLLCLAGNTYDTGFHLMRMDALAQYFSNGGTFPCRIYRNVCNGLGYASPLYYCDALWVPFAFLHSLGVSRDISYKLMMACFAFLPFVTMFYMLNRENIKKNDALWGALFYAFAPFVLGKVIWQQMGSGAANIFLPMVFISLWGLLKNKTYTTKYAVSTSILMGIGLCGIIATHIISLALTLLFGSIIVLIHIKELLFSRKILVLLGAGLIALLLMAWFWAPFLEQMLNCTLSVNARGTNARQLANYAIDPIAFFFNSLIYAVANKLFGTPTLLPGRGFSGGWYVLPVAIFYLKDLRDKTVSGYNLTTKIFGALTACLLFLFFCPPLLRLLSYGMGWIQFVNRFYPFFALFLAIYVVQLIQAWNATSIEKKRTRLVWISCGFLIWFGLLQVDWFGYRAYSYFFVRGKCPECCQSLWSVTDVPEDIGAGEYVPHKAETTFYKISDYQKDKSDSFRKALCDGIEIPIEDTVMGCIVNVPPKSQIIEVPLFYYKGYTADINGSPVTVKESDKGLIQIETCSKQGKLKVAYTGTSIQKYSVWVSGTALAGFILFLFIATILYRRK